MLAAVLHGKAGTVTLDGRIQSWREVFRQREDLLTSVFFGRLRYFSESARQKVLALLIGEENAEGLGSLRDIEYWPKFYGLADRTGYVEPDVLLSFESGTLLVEVKPPWTSQSRQQWTDEISGLLKSDERPEILHFLALGGNAPGWKKVKEDLEEQFSDECRLRIHVVDWESLNRSIRLLLEQAEGHDQAVFEDWLKAFTLYGLSTPMKPFEDLLPLAKGMRSDWPKMVTGWDRTIQLVAPKNNPGVDLLPTWSPIMSLAHPFAREDLKWP